VAALEPKQHYSRKEVCRLLGVNSRQLRRWRQQRLAPDSQTYSFHDLVALRTLLQLRRSKVSPARIRKAIAALKAHLGETADPLTELRIYCEAGQVRVQTGAQRMEAISGQLLLDFDRQEFDKLLALTDLRSKSPDGGHSRRREAEHWFQKGVELEAAGAAFEQVRQCYEKAIELHSNFAAAMVNLGTLFFHVRKLEQAGDYYRRALEADPAYALAHFNLGNLYDEQRDFARAVHHYLEALRLDAQYADAHYNLALLYQTCGETMKAIQHWSSYLRLDPASTWSAIARRELNRLRAATIV